MTPFPRLLKRYLLILPFLFVLLFLAGLFRNPRIYASEQVYFEDDFTGQVLDLNKWAASNNGGLMSVNGGYLKLSSEFSTLFPYIRTISNPFPVEGAYSIELKFKYIQTSPWGTGIILGNLLPIYGISVNDFVQNDAAITQFIVWQSLNDQFLIQTRHCIDQFNCDPNRTTIFQRPYSGDEHVLKISYENNIFSVNLDGNNIANSALENSTRRPSDIIFGNPIISDGNINWTDIWIDYVRVSSVLTDPTITPTPTETPTPTPSPTPIETPTPSPTSTITVTPTPEPTPEVTPTPEPLKPTILIPGLGGSWDVDAIVGGTPGNNWRIPGFVTTYQNLISSLKNAGYEENNNLFVFAYDWRKNLSNLSIDLNNFVQSLIIQGKVTVLDKVNLIGHSYGGLVARAYGQNQGLPRINKIITLGSPHLGVLDAYAAWEGATIWSKSWWQKASLELTMQLNQGSNESRVHTLRRLAPGIKDLLPVYDYLKVDGILKPEVSMIQRNLDLSLLNANMITIDNLLWANAGVGYDSKQTLKVRDRDWIDQINEKWEDGKPEDGDPIEMANGDGTVALVSAKGGFSNTTETTVNHGEMVTSGVALEKVFGELGLDKTKVVDSVPADTRERVLAIMLRSPGQLVICNFNNLCNQDLGTYLPLQKLFMLPDYSDDNLRISVEANGETGEYKLLTGKIDGQGADWRQVDGNLENPSETDTYFLTPLFDTTAPVITPKINPEPNVAGWNNSETTVTWEVADSDSTIVSKTNCDPQIIDTETDGVEIACSATSYGGTSSSSVTIKLDKIGPEINIASPADGARYILGEIINADWTVLDSLSGLDGTENGTVPSGNPIDTGSVGAKTFTVTASDIAGNISTKIVTYSVEYFFEGLLRPVIDSKTFRGSSTIPVKFRLKDLSGRYITTAIGRLYVDGSPASSSGRSNVGNYFRYDPSTNEYIFNLSTKVPVLTIGNHELNVTLDDGSTHLATILIK